MNFITKINDYLNKPNKLNTAATMNVEIKKGEKKGVAWVPCSFETISYGIDVNPSLVRKKTGKKIKDLPLDEKFSYHSKTEKLKLEDDEEVQLEEVAPCPHCGQKLVVSEVCTTKYRSCPLVEITLSTPVDTDVVIPVKFGFNKWQLANTVGMFLLLMSIISLATLATPVSLDIGYFLTITILSVIFIWCSSKLFRLTKWIKETRKLGWEDYNDDFDLRGGEK